MPAVNRKPPLAVGQTWEGKTQEATSMSRRKITALTENEVHWEAIGINAKHTSGRMSPKTFRNWTRRLIIR